MKSKPDKLKRVKPISNPNELPSDVKLLQAELRKARLLNEILTEVINITEVELGRSIRKKSGIKAVLKVEQSKPNRTIRELCSLLGYSTQAYYKFHRATTLWVAEGTYPTPYGIIKLKHIKLPSGEISSEIEAPKEIKIIR